MIAFCSFVNAANSLVKQNFWGVHGEVLKNITEKVSANNVDSSSLVAQSVKDIQEQTTIEIKNALAAYGYFKPIIKSTARKQGSVWIIDYMITPNMPLRITKLDVKITGEGLADEEFKNILNNFPLKLGDILRSKYYQEAKSSLVDLAAQRGYFAAKIERSNILIDLQKYESTIIIHFNSGPRYRFGDVIFLPSPYSEKLLKRFIPFTKGKNYQTKKIIQLQENLNNSNFFQQITVTPLSDRAKDLEVPVTVKVTPRKSKQYNFGAGYGTDTKIRGLAALQFRRFNRYGHQGEAIIQASQRMSHYEASYSIPGTNPVTDLYRLILALEEQHLLTNGQSQYQKIEASQVKMIGGWQQTLSLSIRDEHSVPSVGRPTLNSTMLLPNLNWSKTKSDDLLDPSKGYQINFNLRGASKDLISNADFAQALIQAKALVPVSSVTRLVLKGQLGYTLISDINKLPILLQFYTGGAQTVRGYSFQGIGPGKALLMGSVELQQKIRGHLYTTFFMDAGTVNNVLGKNIKKGIGFGLLWRSTIGAVEVTLAQALNTPGKPRLIQFSVGAGL
jgi:translocation and assembly module TamA